MLRVMSDSDDSDAEREKDLDTDSEQSAYEEDEGTGSSAAESDKESDDDYKVNIPVASAPCWEHTLLSFLVQFCGLHCLWCWFSNITDCPRKHTPDLPYDVFRSRRRRRAGAPLPRAEKTSHQTHRESAVSHTSLCSTLCALLSFVLFIRYVSAEERLCVPRKTRCVVAREARSMHYGEAYPIAH